MTGFENKHLHILMKLNKVLRVIKSCITNDQISNAQNWGLDVVTDSYKKLYGKKAFYIGTSIHNQYISDFESVKLKAKDKAKEIYDKSKKEKLIDNIVVGNLTVRKPFSSQILVSFEISDNKTYNSTLVSLDNIRKVNDYLNKILTENE